ncbi:MAG TPA: hypothetical protein EYP25_02490 [Anaerolineae bacterium]|nr:hypothetical protein [Anaerolineae bacterium]HIQ11401.1 hypothetical protein [Caldilineales bacterium]
MYNGVPPRANSTAFAWDEGKTMSASTIQSLPSDAYERVGRQAWIILWLAFVAFLVMITGGPLAVNWYIHNATRPMAVRVEAVTGATLILPAEHGDPIAVVDSHYIQEGDSVRTDQDARANLAIVDSPDDVESLASVQLRTNSEVELITARRPRFQRSVMPRQLALRLHSGRARVTSGLADGRPLKVHIQTPQGLVVVSNGSAAIAVTNEATEVTARNGKVSLIAQGREVVLSKGRRAIIAFGQPPSDSQPADKNLVSNGDFSQPLESTWRVESIVDARDLSNVTFGSVDVINTGGRNVVYFQREAQGEDANLHSETAIVQDIDADVFDVESLVFRFDVRLISQSLPGGGIQSSEFPMMVRIDFVDVYGKPQFWTHGFYMVDPIENWPLRDGEKIPGLVWYAYESPDFMQSETFPRPAKVTRIRIYASGHNYRSQAADIELIAK